MALAPQAEREKFREDQYAGNLQKMLEEGTLSQGLAHVARAETELRHDGKTETAEYKEALGKLSDVIELMKKNGLEDQIAPVLAEAEMRFKALNENTEATSE